MFGHLKIMEFKYITRCSLFIFIQLDIVIAMSANNCKILNNLLTLKCHGNYPDYVSYSTNVKELHMTNLTWSTLNLNDVLEKFPNVEKIFIQYADINSITLPISINKIQVLHLRFTKINKIPQDFVKTFPNLKILNIENNLLTNIEKNFYLGDLEKLFIKNNPWICSLDLSWALQLNKTTVAKDLANITCKEKFTGKHLLLMAGLIAKYKDEMNKNCTKLCECSLDNVVENKHNHHDNDDYVTIIMVNCSGRGLKELPTHLPLNTRILHLERNEISDLRPLKTNHLFKMLWDLYLDNNTVDSISYLEGSHWLQHFRLFSLTGNRLQKLPAFALDNALMKNPNMPGALRLFLGNNPWRCDCIFVPVFQELVLQKYSKWIPDISDVKCKYVEGDENSLLPIHSLSRSSVCMVPTDFSLQEGLDLLNAILAGLIVFILGKLAYDYYHYKKYGRLPWIVTKMP